MNSLPPENNQRLLVIDDNPAIHDDFHKILASAIGTVAALDATEAALFGAAIPTAPDEGFQIDSAYQGAEGLAKVETSLADGRPYALAFVDVRMPPGWDGLETTTRIWAVDPDIQIVLCTAFSNYSWEDMIAKVGQSDRFLILKKPFANIEVLQLVNALTEKWRLLRQSRVKLQDLERTVIGHQENEERSRRALEHERELQKIKSRFVSIVSHEFRTPLGIINNAAHLLGRYSDRMNGAERGTQLRQIHSAVERMTQMMEDLLIHGNFQSGKLVCNPARVDLVALGRQVIAEAANHPATPRAIEYILAPDATEVFLDEKIVRHILGNLLSNAIKYSADGQAVVLEVTRVRGNTHLDGETLTTPEEQLQLKVSDAGIGIPAEDISRLFQTFQRASNVGNRPGTGMGLAIVKQFVDLHRGTIRVESAVGKGTTVWVWLPLAAPDPLIKTITYLPPSLTPGESFNQP